MQEVLVTPGAFFEGYTIKEYKDPLSAEEIVYILEGYIRMIDNDKNKEYVKKCLSDGRKIAMVKLKQKAKDCNCNGIIGFNCSYLTFEPSNRILSNYFFCLVANGTPVIIEKKDN